jgi:hypothetical protein
MRKQRLFIYEYLKEAHLHWSLLISTVFIPAAGVYFDVFITLISSILLLYFVWPNISRTSLVLLQTAPERFKTSLNKCIREASFIDGVLECHDEHFWAIGMGQRASIIGTIKVRVSTDANEQLVLQSVKSVFQQKSFISDLTIQVEKDNWNLMGSNSNHITQKNNFGLSELNFPLPNNYQTMTFASSDLTMDDTDSHKANDLLSSTHNTEQISIAIYNTEIGEQVQEQNKEDVNNNEGKTD